MVKRPFVLFAALPFVAAAQQPARESAYLDAGFVSYVRVLKPTGGMGESEASVVRGG